MNAHVTLFSRYVGDQMAQIVPSAGITAVMAQVKAEGDTVRSHQDCAEYKRCVKT